MAPIRKLSVAFALIAILISPVGIAGVGDKVTGGAETVIAGSVTLSLTANAVTTPKGIKGNIQYSREAQAGAVELYVHASVECLGVYAGGLEAVMAGPAMVQSNPNAIPTGDWFVVAVREGGTGAGDDVRAFFATEALGRAACESDPESFPGEVLEGNFTIRAGQL